MTEIPPITDPMGRHWDQPPLSEILVDDMHALMSKQAFNHLLTYSTSLPTGTYSGKMWKARFPWRGEPATWMLCWYGAIEGKDILIHRRPILFL